MQYPNTEDSQLALAMRVAESLSQNFNTFPYPPVPNAELHQLINAYQKKRELADNMIAQAQMATLDKDEALEMLNIALKSNLRYAENEVNFNNERLKLIGWGGQAAPVLLQPPGEPRTLEVVRQGEGWVYIDWKEPAEGGKVAAYKVQRSMDGAMSWKDAAVTIGSEYTLHNQPRGKNILFQVVAINKVGEGTPSNIVGVRV